MNTKLSTLCDKIIEAGWLAAAVTVPLYFNIYSARTFEPDKITLLRSIVSIMILAWIILVVEQGGSESGTSSILLGERFRRWLKTPLFLPTSLLVLIYIVSTILSISPLVSLWGSYQRMEGTYSALSYMVIFAMVAGHLRRREQVDRLVTTVIIASIPVSLYGIVQRYGLDPLPWAGDVTQRVASNMGNAIFVASYLIMIIPLTLSRLIKSMMAIIKEDDASWGHTILAAVYIFGLAVQIITVIFTQSRGPMLGLLGAFYVMGLLLILILRRLDNDASNLSLAETATGIGFVVPLGLAGGIVAGAGFLLGSGLQSLLLNLNYQVAGLSFLGAALGGMLGFFGLYTYMTASHKGWRWLWLSWVSIGIAAIGSVVVLNIRQTPLDPYLDPIRELPYVSRLSQVIETSGTGRVRVLIWDAAMELIAPHEGLGIPGDPEVGQDRFNLIRPLIGYGPESMFNAFAYVYPPDLAHVENRGSSADRSHNETMDSLVITGILGFLAFYFLMVSLFYYALRWLGWAADRASQRGLIAILLLTGIIGAVAPAFLDKEGSPYTFAPLGLPFGLIAGLMIFLIWQGLIRQGDISDTLKFSDYTLLLIGVLGAIVGHFIEVHFVFSIAATYTYFWIYAGLIVALSKISSLEAEAASEASSEETETTEEVAEEEPAPPESNTAPSRRRQRRARRGARNKVPAAARSSRAGPMSAYVTGRENWETWLGGQALAMAIILITLVFDFITPQFQFSFANIWMFVITWLIGLTIALSDIAVRRDGWQVEVNWGRAVAIYSVVSLSYFFFYILAHRLQLGQRIAVSAVGDVIRAANVLAFVLVVFYIFLFLLMVLFAVMLSRRLMRGLPGWRPENWWLYPPLAVAIVLIIWFQNINVVRADIYLKEGERYRNGRQWDYAIALHEKAVSLDSDEDFYYLMLALDYQLLAQDNNVPAERRQIAWQEGERIALEARSINPYNPDNTGNMGRYYFTLGQVFDQERFSTALEFFEKAVTLAPSNVIYHNLLAQTYYIMQDYEKAIERLEISKSIDPRYPPTWVLLGDAYAALGNVDEAFAAHTEALNLVVRGSDGFAVFADQFVDQRLNFYISAGRLAELIAAMQQVELDRPETALIPATIARAYSLAGRPEEATPYFERAFALGDTSDRTIRGIASTALTLKSYDQALSGYQMLIQQNPNDVEAHSALAFIYAQQGRLDEAIQENQWVLQQLPNDYDSLKNLAILYQRKEQWPEALEAAQQAQTVAPEAEQPSWQQFITDIESVLATAG